MANLIVYYAHPGNRFSQANKAMAVAARDVQGISFVDLYAEYPRFNIEIDREQQRLLEHDVIVFQFPLFWYSTPSLIKEWQDLVLEHGFAYGAGGDKLRGKRLLTAVTAASDREVFMSEGCEHNAIRTFMKPLERTARLCRMKFAAPYVLYGSLLAPEDGRLMTHVLGYKALLEAIRDDRYDFDANADGEIECGSQLPVAQEV